MGGGSKNLTLVVTSTSGPMAMTVPYFPGNGFNFDTPGFPVADPMPEDPQR